MRAEGRAQALAEAQFCEAILAKTGDTVLTATLQGAETVLHWDHFPKGDVIDRANGATWFYHCHPPGRETRADPRAEHGHFHCFLRPNDAKGPLHHLIALGVDAQGRPLRFFTVNHWVVGDDWLAAEPTIAMLPQFDVHLARPCYLVNRWLTAMIRAYEPQITMLIAERDQRILAQGRDENESRQDRSLEVTSELWIDAQE